MSCYNMRYFFVLAHIGSYPDPRRRSWGKAMSKHDYCGGGDQAEYREEPVSEVLAEMTDRPASEFQAGNEYEYPHPDELESVPQDER